MLKALKKLKLIKEQVDNVQYDSIPLKMFEKLDLLCSEYMIEQMSKGTKQLSDTFANK